MAVVEECTTAVSDVRGGALQSSTARVKFTIRKLCPKTTAYGGRGNVNERSFAPFPTRRGGTQAGHPIGGGGREARTADSAILGLHADQCSRQ